MNITYTWKIDMINTTSKDGVIDAVTEINWSKHAKDEQGNTARYPMFCKFDIEDIKKLKEFGNFTALSELTEERVLDWVKNSLSFEDMDFIDFQLEKSIEEQINKLEQKSLDYKQFPWAK
jgi:hypothetical protein